MKSHYIFVILLMTYSSILYSQEISPLIGKWTLKEIMVKDYDGTYIYENYNEYVKLKEQIYKQKLQPSIDIYTETKTIVFHNDNTGYIENITEINRTAVTIDWKNNLWEKSENQEKVIFTWSVTDEKLNISNNKISYIYNYNIIDLSENQVKLAIQDIHKEKESLIEKGIYNYEK